MNFLQICQRTTREAGINLSGPTGTSGNDGTEFQRVVDWVNAAYAEIQMKNDDWRFMNQSFSLTCTPADGAYAMTDVAVAGTTIARYDADSLRYYLQSDGQSTEQRMYWYDYDHFRDLFRFGATRTQAGPPQYFTESPSKELLLYPIPGPGVYIVTGEYYRGVDELSGDSDTPIIPTDFHMLIVYWAVWKYAGFDEASAQYMNAQSMMNQYIGRLERQERPSIRLGETFA